MITQKDISFSNSMVEAVNKQMKYNWLIRLSIADITQLRSELDAFFHEHNFIKPLEVLRGYTDLEVLPFVDEIREARLKRVEDVIDWD